MQDFRHAATGVGGASHANNHVVKWSAVRFHGLIKRLTSLNFVNERVQNHGHGISWRLLAHNF